MSRGSGPSGPVIPRRCATGDLGRRSQRVARFDAETIRADASSKGRHLPPIRSGCRNHAARHRPSRECRIAERNKPGLPRAENTPSVSEGESPDRIAQMAHRACRSVSTTCRRGQTRARRVGIRPAVKAYFVTDVEPPAGCPRPVHPRRGFGGSRHRPCLWYCTADGDQSALARRSGGGYRSIDGPRQLTFGGRRPGRRTAARNRPPAPPPTVRAALHTGTRGGPRAPGTGDR